MSAPRALVFLVLLLSAFASSAQGSPAPPADSQLQHLADAQRWSDIVQLVEPTGSRTPDDDFYLGIALAQLGRLADAQSALEAGRRLAPSDPRFPTELAGLAFKQKSYAQTVRLLRRALRLAPNDAYAINFLATTYNLEGNLEAALKFWNRIGKPQIVTVRANPVPRVAPALLDHAFAFSPASTLTLPQLLNSSARVRALGIFPQFRFDLDARLDGASDVLFQNHEKNGFGGAKLESLFLFLRGLPFQQVNPQFYNFRHHAINFTSMYRWDAQKRRIFADLSGPFQGSAKIRWQLTADLRSENWALRNGFTGPAPVLAGFNLRSERAAFTLASHASDRLSWSISAEASHRNFRGIVPGTLLTPQLLASGYQLKQQAQLAGVLWRIPERRFTVTAAASSEAARFWSQSGRSFEKLTGSVRWHWFPQAQGDDYETSQQLRAGRTFGQPPFDELFILGLERDNDLPLRAHIGTRDGRKGSAPLGRNYILENWDFGKNLYGNGFLRFQLGPFFDAGKITNPGTSLGSRQWLFDTGAQLKLRVFSAGLVFSWGRDVHSGNNAFYVSLLQ